MSKILIDQDDDLGSKLYYQPDADGGTLISEQDVAPILEDNKLQHSVGFDKRKDMWHAARVPYAVIDLWKSLYGVDFWNPNHKAKVMALLNSSDWSHLRTNQFKI